MKYKVILLLSCICQFGCNGGEGGPTNLSIEDTIWRLDSYGYEADVKKSIIQETSYVVEFVSSTNIVSGNIDCNTFSSMYSITDNQIDIESVAPTEIACPLAGSGEYEDQNAFVVSSLSSATTYSISDQELVITSVDSSQLVFVEAGE